MNRTTASINTRGRGRSSSSSPRGRQADPGPPTSSGSSSESPSRSGSTSSGYSSGSDTELQPHKSKPKVTKDTSKSNGKKGPLLGAPGSILDSFLTHVEAANPPSNSTNGTATAARMVSIPVATVPEGAADPTSVPLDSKAAKKAAKQTKKQSRHVPVVRSAIATSHSAPSASPASPASQALTYPLSGALPVLTLLTALGATAASPWSQQDILSDMVALSNVRIRTVDDLRYVPKKGWKDLPIPAVVSDRLRRCVWVGMDKRHVREMEQGFLNSVAVALANGGSYVPKAASPTVAPAPKPAAPSANDGQPKRTIETEETNVPTPAPRAANGGVHTKADDKPEGYWSNLAAQFLGTASPAVDATPRSPSPSQPTNMTTTTNLDPSNPTALVNALLYNGTAGPQWMPPTLDEVMSTSPTSPPPGKRELKPAVAAAMAALNLQPEEQPASKPMAANGATKLSATDLSSTELVHSLLHTGAMVASSDALLANNEDTTMTGKTMPAAQQPQLGLVPGNPNRVRVTNGRQVFEVDRYCPHKQYDMLKAPAMRGNVLTCPKHDWDFDLGKGGICVGRPGKSLNCAVVSDW